jgi:hypothetical protein
MVTVEVNGVKVRRAAGRPVRLGKGVGTKPVASRKAAAKASPGRRKRGA